MLVWASTAGGDPEGTAGAGTRECIGGDDEGGWAGCAGTAPGPAVAGAAGAGSLVVEHFGVGVFICAGFICGV